MTGYHKDAIEENLRIFDRTFGNDDEYDESGIFNQDPADLITIADSIDGSKLAGKKQPSLTPNPDGSLEKLFRAQQISDQPTTKRKGRRRDFKDQASIVRNALEQAVVTKETIPAKTNISLSAWDAMLEKSFNTETPFPSSDEGDRKVERLKSSSDHKPRRQARRASVDLLRTSTSDHKPRRQYRRGSMDQLTNGGSDHRPRRQLKKGTTDISLQSNSDHRPRRRTRRASLGMMTNETLSNSSNHEGRRERRHSGGRNKELDGSLSSRSKERRSKSRRRASISTNNASKTGRDRSNTLSPSRVRKAAVSSKVLLGEVKW